MDQPPPPGTRPHPRPLRLSRTVQRLVAAAGCLVAGVGGAVLVAAAPAAGAGVPAGAPALSDKMPTSEQLSAAHVRSGVLDLSATTGSLTGTLHLSITPATGAGRQLCDPRNTSYAVVYAAAPGDEYGVAGESVNYTILAPQDGSAVPAGGTLTDYLPSVVDPDFPASGGVPELDSTTNGTYSLGVRCQDETSDHIFQNYWTTVTIAKGSWTLGTPGTTSAPTSSTTSSTGTSASGTTTATASPGQASGSLRITPDSGSLLSGSHTLTAVPAAGAGSQPCGTVQTFALLYFVPVGHEFAGAGVAGVTLKSRPLQAAGLDVPIGGSLPPFLSAVGQVDFSQSLGASETWQQPLAAGTYSVGVRCQSGTATDPTIYQNYFTQVTVAADGSWRTAGSGTSTTATPTTSSATTAGRSVVVTLLDAAGRRLPSPASVSGGEQLFLSAAGFGPGEQATVVLGPEGTTLATGAAVDGQIAMAIVLPPAIRLGNHTLTVRGTSGLIGSLGIVVHAAPTTTGSRSTATSTRSTPTGSGTSTQSGAATSVRTSPTSATVTTSTVTPTTTSTSSLGGTSPGTSPGTAAGGAGSGGSPVPPAAGGSGTPGLAYTGYPVTDSVHAGVLLVGVGVILLSLCQGYRKPNAGHR